MDYKPNSNRFREEQKMAAQEETKKRTEKIVNGRVRTKKKSEISRLADIFVPGDISKVKDYAFSDVIVPNIKKAVYDIVVNGLEMFMYGETGRHERRSGSRVSYSRYYDERDRDRRRDDSPRARTRLDFEDIVFDSKGEAEGVREEMMNVIDEYGFVTVADMYDMAGLDQPYTSNKFGWTSIRSAESVRLRDGGYILKLPRPMPID